MKRLLIRADDLGYSDGVNVGIRRAVEGGLVRSVGLMPNMPLAQAGWDLVKDEDIAIGQHTNVCLGKPVSDPALIPSLVGPDGNFKSSRTYRESFKQGVDFVDFDEAVTEITAQLERFRQIVGRDPDYFEAHAVASKNLFAAISAVAEREGLLEQPVSFVEADTVPVGGIPTHMAIEDMQPVETYDPRGFLRRVATGMADGDVYVCVFHPGYLDWFLINNSSLTTNRTKEVDALRDKELAEWLETQVTLIDYRDLAR